MTIFGKDDRKVSNIPNVLKGTSPKGNFTGALVSNDLILTAAHVIGYGGKTFFETIQGNIEAYVVYENNIDDVALYQLKQKVSIEPLKLKIPTQQLLNLGTTLVGYHADKPGQSSITDYNTNYFKEYDEITYTLDAYKGSSGGPLLDYKGRIIGVNHSQSFDSNYGTSISYKLINIIKSFDSKKNGPSKIVNNKPLLDNNDIVRILDKSSVTHMYTSDINLVEDLKLDSRFVIEDVWKGDTEKDVYSFHNSKTNNWFYTSDYMEMLYVSDNLPDYFENGRVFGVEDNTIHRLYNPESGHHFYTDSLEENNYVIANLGYRNEGFL